MDKWGSNPNFGSVKPTKQATTTVADIERILRNPNQIQGLADFIKSDHCRKIIILSGAGISVSAGIPDFRSKDGLFNTLDVNNESLRLTELQKDLIRSSPEYVADIALFRSNPYPLYCTLKDFYTKQYDPTPCHWFIKLLHNKGKLHRIYTQNIDGLHEKTFTVNPNSAIDKDVDINKSDGSQGSQRSQRSQGSEEKSAPTKDTVNDVETSDINAVTSGIKGMNVTDVNSNIKESDFESLIEEKVVAVHGTLSAGKCICCNCLYQGEEFQRKFVDKIAEQGKDVEPIYCDSMYCVTGNKMGLASNLKLSDNNNYIKPNVVLYGEKLPLRYFKLVEQKRDVERNCDLLIVIGTSLNVYPVAHVVNKVGHRCVRVVINKTKLQLPVRVFEEREMEFNQDCDKVAMQLIEALGWTQEFAKERKAFEMMKECKGKREKIIEKETNNDSIKTEVESFEFGPGL